MEAEYKSAPSITIRLMASIRPNRTTINMLSNTRRLTLIVALSVLTLVSNARAEGNPPKIGECCSGKQCAGPCHSVTGKLSGSNDLGQGGCVSFLPAETLQAVCRKADCSAPCKAGPFPAGICLTAKEQTIGCVQI